MDMNESQACVEPGKEPVGHAEDPANDAVPSPETCSRATRSDPDVDCDPARGIATNSPARSEGHTRNHGAEGRINVLRELWKDVAFAPLERAIIVRIPYSKEFSVTFGLLLVARQLGEVSSRALDLCSRAIHLNPSDVTTWSYRHEIVTKMCAEICGEEGHHTEESMKLISVEFAFIEGLIESAPKSYQIWEYRRFLICLANRNPNDDISFTNAALDDDPKNYHAWAHRAWLVNTGAMHLPLELEDTQKFVEADVRNNSAWSHRWTVTDLLDNRNTAEMEWALAQMRTAPRNESVWNYIAALANDNVCNDQAVAAAREIIEKDHENVPARRHLILCDGSTLSEKISHCENLASKFDKERYRYWCWKADCLRLGRDGVAAE